jgi:hypothetical protein
MPAEGTQAGPTHTGEATVTLTLSDADALRLIQCLGRLKIVEQARYEEALQRLEDNPRDEGHAERRGRIRGELDALTAMAHDAERLHNLVYDARHPGSRRSGPSGR